MNKIIQALVVITFATVAMSANALTVNICGYWQVNYDDADASVGDDAYTSNSNKQARGVYMRVMPKSGGAYLFDDYTDINGCTGNLFLMPGVEYDIRFLTKAKLYNNNEVKVYEYSGGSYAIKGYSASGIFYSSGTVGVANGVQNAMTNITSAAAFTIFGHDGGLSSQTYEIRYNDPTITENKFTNGYVYLNSSIGYKRKYIIAHELGHAVLYKKTGDVGQDYSFDSYGTKCAQGSTDGNHGLTTKEYQSAALYEGFGHFYSAATWNYETAGADCKFGYYKDVDYDDDGDADPKPIINCETGDYSPGNSWMENKCPSPYSGYGNEWDWLMTWWDIRTDSTPIAFNTILETLHDIDPGDWHTSEGNLYGYCQTAADTNGYLSAFNSWTSFNGVDH